MTDPTPTTPPVPAPPASKHRRWPWIVAIVAALFVGIGIGSAAPNDTEPTAAASASAKQAGALDKPDPRVAELESQVTALTEERDALQSTSDTQAARIGELEDQLAAAVAEPEPAEEEPADGTYTAGDYTFADVQVSEDYAGDFELRARVTNDGGDISGVVWTATLFSDGTVVGTLNGSAGSLPGGQTVTAEFFSLDSYTDWDEIEFQVDTEF